MCQSFNVCRHGRSTPARSPRPTRSKYKGRFVWICGDTVRTSKNIGSLPSKNLNINAPNDTLFFDQRTSIFCMLRLPRYGGKVRGVRIRPHSCILTYRYSHSPRRALQFVQCFKQPATQASIVKNGFPENRRATHCLLRPIRRTASPGAGD